MKELKTLTLVFLALVLGFLFKDWTGWPLPAVVWALVIFYACLASRLLKLEEAETISQVFLGCMGLFFVPVSVGLLEVYPQIAHVIGPILLILLVSTLLAYGATALVVEALIRKEEGHGDS